MLGERGASLRLDILHADKQPDTLRDHVGKLKEVGAPLTLSLMAYSLGRE